MSSAHATSRWQVKSVAAFVAAAVAIGAALELVASRREARKFPVPGDLIDIGGYRLHARIDGVGSPVVVLEAGLGMSSLYWSAVQDEVAQFTRVVSYDRAGLGWSEAGPKPRESSQIARELHAMLAAADLGGPYVLVGHSFGGVHVRAFALRYPDDVAGIVLVDASPEGQEVRWPKRPFLALARQHVATIARRSWPVLARIGVARLIHAIHSPQWGLPPHLQAASSFVASRIVALRTVLDEERAIQASYGQSAGALGDTPLVVLSALWRESQYGTDYRDFNAMWMELQAGLAALSTRGIHIIANTDKHLIPIYEPQLVVGAIKQVIDAAGHG